MDENVTTEELEATELSAAEKKKRDKEQKAKEKSKNKTKKVIITTTYFITVLCLLAGLLVPLFNCVSEGTGSVVTQRMMLQYIPAMFNNVCEFIAKKTVLPAPTGWFLAYPCDTLVDFFISLVGVLYAVVCVFALLMCIPVFLGSKKKNTSANCALAAEVLTIIVTACYIGFKTYGLVNKGTLTWTDYNFLIPFGGALLMGIIQSITSKGSIGVSKTFAVLLSALGVMAILDVTLFINALKPYLIELSQLIKSGDKLGFIIGLGSDLNLSELGVDGINILVSIKELYAPIFSSDPMTIVVYVLLILVSLFTVLNLIVDIIGLGTGKKYNNKRVPCANRGSNTYALVRYILTFLFGGGIIALSFFIDGITAGLYLYLLEAILFIEIINAAARTACDNARVKKGQPAPATGGQNDFVIGDPDFVIPVDDTVAYSETPVYGEPAPAPAAEYTEAIQQPVYDQPVYEETGYDQPVDQNYQQPDYSQPVDQSYQQPDYGNEYAPNAYADNGYGQNGYEEPVYEQPLSNEYLDEYNSAYNPAPIAPVEEQQPAEPAPTVYIYGGASDEFMNTLTDTEKVEFVEVFIKKSKGVVKGVPDYVIDADNSDFFPAVFVHINRYRNIVSDALMSKMYRQLGNL